MLLIAIILIWLRQRALTSPSRFALPSEPVQLTLSNVRKVLNLLSIAVASLRQTLRRLWKARVWHGSAAGLHRQTSLIWSRQIFCLGIGLATPGNANRDGLVRAFFFSYVLSFSNTYRQRSTKVPSVTLLDRPTRQASKCMGRRVEQTDDEECLPLIIIIINKINQLQPL